MSTEYKFHPVCLCWPEMPEAEYYKLRDNIAKHGVLNPIWLYEGMILDGRHRYLAAQETGQPFVVNHYTGDAPGEFVVSMNDRRRHDTESQRAMAAAKLAKYEKGRPKLNASREAFNDSTEKTSPETPLSQTNAAELLDVSRSSVQRAQIVLEHGTEEEIAAVESGAAAVKPVAAAVAARAPKPVIPPPDPKEHVDEHRKFRALFGNAATNALIEGSLENLRDPKDVAFLLALPEAKIRSIEELVLTQRWKPSRAKKFIEGEITGDDRINVLTNRCIAAKGSFSVKINGFTYTVNHDKTY